MTGDHAASLALGASSPHGCPSSSGALPTALVGLCSDSRARAMENPQSRTGVLAERPRVDVRVGLPGRGQLFLRPSRPVDRRAGSLPGWMLFLFEEAQPRWSHPWDRGAVESCSFESGPGALAQHVEKRSGSITELRGRKLDVRTGCHLGIGSLLLTFKEQQQRSPFPLRPQWPVSPRAREAEAVMFLRRTLRECLP